MLIQIKMCLIKYKFYIKHRGFQTKFHFIQCFMFYILSSRGSHNEHIFLHLIFFSEIQAEKNQKRAAKASAAQEMAAALFEKKTVDMDTGSEKQKSNQVEGPKENAEEKNMSKCTVVQDNAQTSNMSIQRQPLQELPPPWNQRQFPQQWNSISPQEILYNSMWNQNPAYYNQIQTNPWSHMRQDNQTMNFTYGNPHQIQNTYPMMQSFPVMPRNESDNVQHFPV